ncbi:uncharacterized protein LOC110846531 [Folsomia candida]|uniref:Uncharacterized protein n=1 Tax=Folsomia candida TaxID=158441 RepID=A0A226EMS6_FOLCA|nr:uncharacterized protein LOC110846531 [Folsomia candida]OXA58081.1 hypothetical protein Fcan01_06557 [Folsomia candida]
MTGSRQIFLFFVMLHVKVAYPQNMDTLTDLLLSPSNEETVSYPPLIQRRLFNTSYATTISLFSFSLPRKSTHTETDLDLANQAIFGIFAIVVATVFLALPAIFTSVRHPDLAEADRSLGSITDSKHSLKRLMESPTIFNFMTKTSDLSNKIGLDGTSCIQRAVCESHRFPNNKQYGLLAVPFQLLCPPSSSSSQIDMRKLELSSPFKKAAWTGKYSDVKCGKEYHCFFDLLGLGSYFVDWYYQHEL